MVPLRWLFLLLALPCLQAIPVPRQPRGADKEQAPADRMDAERIARLIDQLGSRELPDEEATKALDAVGVPALNALRTARRTSGDAEIRRRAARGWWRPSRAAGRSAGLLARKIVAISQFISESHVTRVKQGELVDRMIGRDIYRQNQETISADTAKRLANIGDMSEKELVILLTRSPGAVGSNRGKYNPRDVPQAVQRMLSQLDPYASYDPEAHICVDPAFVPVGVGLRLRTDPATTLPQVLTPLKEWPCLPGGIKTGDLITHITLTTNSA